MAQGYIYSEMLGSKDFTRVERESRMKDADVAFAPLFTTAKLRARIRRLEVQRVDQIGREAENGFGAAQIRYEGEAVFYDPFSPEADHWLANARELCDMFDGIGDWGH